MKLLVELLLLLSAVTAAAPASEANVVQDTAPSVHKIVIFNDLRSEDIMAFGTAFFIKTDNGKVYGVTNDHVCLMMGGRETYLRNVDGKRKIDYKSDQAFKVKAISLSMGEDLCFFTVDGSTPKNTLRLGNDSNRLDRVTVVGYPMDQLNVIAEDGYVSDTVQVREPVALVRCPLPRMGKLEAIMCGLFNMTFEYHTTHQYQISPNIGPGFSGSPVVNQSGQVVGIIARYIAPSDLYTNGHGLMIPVSTIKKYLSDVELVSVKDKKVEKFSQMMRISNEIERYLEQEFEAEKDFVLGTVKEIMSEGNGP